jgi:hypothetical protein
MGLYNIKDPEAKMCVRPQLKVSLRQHSSSSSMIMESSIKFFQLGLPTENLKSRITHLERLGSDWQVPTKWANSRRSQLARACQNLIQSLKEEVPVGGKEKNTTSVINGLMRSRCDASWSIVQYSMRRSCCDVSGYVLGEICIPDLSEIFWPSAVL